MGKSVVYEFKGTGNFARFARGVETGGRRIRKQFKGIATDSKFASLGLASVGNKSVALGQKLRTMSLLAGAAAIASAKSFGDLESGVVSVLTLLDNDEIVRFQKDIERLSEDAIRMGFSIQDVTKGLFDNISALGANSRSFEAYEAAQILAIGGVTTLATSVKGLSAIMNAYGDEAGTATEIANAFFAAQKKGTTTVERLSLNVGKVAPIAKSAGVGYKELLATMAQLTQGGLSTEEASTALRGVLTSLLKPSKEAEKILRKLGVPMRASGLRAAGLAKTLGILTDRTKKFPDALNLAIPNIRGFTAAAALGTKEIERIGRIIESTEIDFLTPAAERQMSTFNHEMKETFGAIKVLATIIGNALAPLIKLLGVIIRGVTSKLISFRETFGTIAASLLVVGTILSGVLVFFGKFALVVSAIASVISLPIVLAVAGIVSLGVLVFKQWDNIKAIGQKIKSFFGFGTGADDLTVNGVADISSSSTFDATLTVVAPKGVVERLTSKSSGAITRTGTQLVETF